MGGLVRFFTFDILWGKRFMSVARALRCDIDHCRFTEPILGIKIM